MATQSHTVEGPKLDGNPRDHLVQPSCLQMRKRRAGEVKQRAQAPTAIREIQTDLESPSQGPFSQHTPPHQYDSIWARFSEVFKLSPAVGKAPEIRQCQTNATPSPKGDGRNFPARETHRSSRTSGESVVCGLPKPDPQSTHTIT